MKKEHNDFQILKTVEADSSISQRRLSSQMELNVASVNFALKRLIQKGFIKKEGVNPRRTKYYITPEGLREKTHLAYKFVGQNIHYYNEIIPGSGVYLVNIIIEGINKCYKGLCNIGFKPTLGKIEKKASMEVLIKGLKRDIYGKKVEVFFIKKLRKEKKFSNMEKLKQQIRIDNSRYLEKGKR